nr:iron-containing alcohol dehydrogenase [Sagittula salina]
MVPRRTLSGRGSRFRIVPALAATTGPVVVVRGQSAAWADTLVRDLRRIGRSVLEITGQGEPDLPTLDAALAGLRPHRPGAVVSIGGGSVMDLGKALAALLPSANSPMTHLEVVGDGRPLEAAPLPFVAVPTTAGTGAEATKNAVIDVPAQRRKVSLRDARMLPWLAVLDADLTDGTPWPVTLACGMDALTQLIEPYLSARARPDVDAICRVAIPEAMRALLRLSQGKDGPARDVLLAAAHLSGIALANAGLGAVHGLAGVIGGQTGAPHGAICARLLPAVLRANRQACIEAGQDATRFADVDAMIADAFKREGSATALLQGFLRNAPLAPLPEMDDAQVAAMAAESSSMKANPVVLSTAVLAGVIAEGRALGS